MIDLETLGTKPDCVVLTLGAIKFNPYKQTEPDKGLYIRSRNAVHMYLLLFTNCNQSSQTSKVNLAIAN